MPSISQFEICKMPKWCCFPCSAHCTGNMLPLSSSGEDALFPNLQHALSWGLLQSRAAYIPVSLRVALEADPSPSAFSSSQIGSNMNLQLQRQAVLPLISQKPLYHPITQIKISTSKTLILPWNLPLTSLWHNCSDISDICELQFRIKVVP